MADGERLGASFSIDVTNLKAGLTQANKLIRESESEFKAAAAGLDDWTKSEEGLNAKIKSLNDITEVQRKKVDALQSEYSELIRNGLDPTSNAAVELRTKINNEQAALAKNEAELKKQKEALENLEDSSDDAADAMEDAGEAAKEAGDGFTIAKGAIADLISRGFTALVGAAKNAISSVLGLADATRETRTAMAKLDQSFQTAGIDADFATDTLYELQGVLGDTDRSVEAANLLAKMSKNGEDLAANTRILTGVFAEYGDSIPTEGLAEGMQATA